MQVQNTAQPLELYKQAQAQKKAAPKKAAAKKEEVKAEAKKFAKAGANYPIYLHCAAGVDRTGEIVFLLDMILGVDEERALLDYEASSLSYYPRPRTIGYFRKWLDTIREMSPEGTPRAQQIVNYLKKIGVTEQDIAAIRSIMLEP